MNSKCNLSVPLLLFQRLRSVLRCFNRDLHVSTESDRPGTPTRMKVRWNKINDTVESVWNLKNKNQI